MISFRPPAGRWAGSEKPAIYRYNDVTLYPIADFFVQYFSDIFYKIFTTRMILVS